MRQTLYTTIRYMPHSFHSDDDMEDEQHVAEEEQDHTPHGMHGSHDIPSLVHVANSERPILTLQFEQATWSPNGIGNALLCQVVLSRIDTLYRLEYPIISYSMIDHTIRDEFFTAWTRLVQWEEDPIEKWRKTFHTRASQILSCRYREA